MADRRMFTKKITDSDAFVELPSSAQAFYFHLNQGADDDGFNNQVQIAMFRAHATMDDLKLLILKKFVIRFESGVIVIKHWRMHNYIRKDTYNETTYKDEKSLLKLDENKAYTFDENQLSLLSVDESSTQDKLGKVSIGKDNNVVVDDIRTREEENLFEFYERMTGKTINPSEYEVIGTWEDNELTRYVIKQSALARATSIKYIQAILSSYEKEGIKTVAEAEESNRKFKEKKNNNNQSKRPIYKSKAEREEEAVKEFYREHGVEEDE